MKKNPFITRPDTFLTPEQKAELADQIADDVEAFIARGNKIQVLGTTPLRTNTHPYRVKDQKL